MGRSRDPSFEAFVVARTPALVRTAKAILGDRGEAQDAVQEALIAVSRRWRRVEEGEEEAYARTAVVNRCLDVLRQRRRRPATRRITSADEPLAPDHADRVVVQTEVRHLLSRLSPRQQAVLALRYWDGCSEAEIAAALGISTGTVKSTTSDAMSALRRLTGRRLPSKGPTS